jgi:hypothetical protein
MTNEQRKEELVKCIEEIATTKKAIQVARQNYDLIRYKYENEYIDIRLALKDSIAKRSDQLTYLLTKSRILSDTSIDLNKIGIYEIDQYVKEHMEKYLEKLVH